MQYKPGDKVRVLSGSNRLFQDDYIFKKHELAVVIDIDYETHDGYEIQIESLTNPDHYTWIPAGNVDTKFSQKDIEQISLWQMKK